ncbi:cell death-inducing p53-target protein 1 [Pimephales promelas]|uniref:cell death-inducing p53-target protein 1 n=1 Tax=Pimephales promelas TaxID=90988 RepID=UPI0019554EAD|nr:cell death-inducing p53-target protein 1 [Pimephales promelas]XP_039542856.1 cell death-inducing p53-target protein 1 [Pimephales promelas]XP_039542857.1 cell death-inducing p53-target protein 1 [Pimephales promelas]KAG1967794.1 lipopolysaccharide-induced tumor necrosis factor-alpha factor [Pimephales promelas]
MSRMSADGTGDPPPYAIPIEGAGGSNVKVYHVHTPFTPQSSTIRDLGIQEKASTSVQSQSTEAKNKFVGYDSYELGRTPGMATCTHCQQQVLTEISYKRGVFAWASFVLFILCGLILFCCLIPLFAKHFKDVYHTCPKCSKILHIEKKRCC